MNMSELDQFKRNRPVRAQETRLEDIAKGVVRFMSDHKVQDAALDRIAETPIFREYIRPAAEKIYDFVRVDNARGSNTDPSMRNPDMPSDPYEAARYIRKMEEQGFEYPMLNEKGVAFMKAGPNRLTDAEMVERRRILSESR